MRSPCEFALGHLPGAHSLPLFSDEERATVGTLYKQQGASTATLKGTELFLPKLKSYIASLDSLPQKGPMRIYCSRGGMRSQSVGQLLKVMHRPHWVLEGGYKSFRNLALQLFHFPFSFLVLGGLTGSGKTAILKTLEEKSVPILDLEALAQHRGSAFGGLPHSPQPSQQQFENQLALQLFSLKGKQGIWVEDESRLIGKRVIPAPLFQQLSQSPLFVISPPLKERLSTLTAQYQNIGDEALIQGVHQLKKRLGHEKIQTLMELGKKGDYLKAAQILLHYYDSRYQHALEKKKSPPTFFYGKGLSSTQWAAALLHSARQRNF